MKRDFAALCGRQFDLLVCGGGIYGAWTAYDAVLRGLQVGIVEQGDWACATSSASSKLIHGGLRYLESFDFRLVRKSLRERKMLLQAAPHRVWPLRFGVPVYEDSRLGTLRIEVGLSIYDFLANEPDPDMAHRYFKREEFSRHFPGLDTAGLKGGFIYADAQTDDARLVLELISGAMEAGAVCVNYGKLAGAPEINGGVYTATVQDQLDNTHAEILARQIVNATGQWTALTEEARGWCRLTKGVHLVLPGTSCDEALLLTARSDGRVFFIIPWYGRSLLGTTDTDYSGDFARVAVEAADVAYLLAEANHYLRTDWTEADVIGSYAGSRVLMRSGKSEPSAASRGWELKTARNGVHYSIGGKITSSREDAAHIVDTVCAQLGVHVPCRTKGKAFPWAPQEDFTAWRIAMYAEAARLGIDEEAAKWLLRRHGKRVGEIFRIIEADPKLTARITPALPFIYADLLWSARDEMAVHLSDLLRRRMPLLILATLDQSELQRLAEMIAPAMGWDAAMIKHEIETCCS